MLTVNGLELSVRGLGCLVCGWGLGFRVDV